jgi:hypothetical protein
MEDTPATMEDIAIGPRPLDVYIQEYWDQEHQTDAALASEMIYGRLAKSGMTPEQWIGKILGMEEGLTGDPDFILRAIIRMEYSRSLSAEDLLVFGAGLMPNTAACLIALADCTAEADEAAEELIGALAMEDFSALCRSVYKPGLTDPTVAASVVLDRLPVVSEMTPSVRKSDCAHNARKHFLAALASAYADFLAEEQQRVVTSAGGEA